MTTPFIGGRFQAIGAAGVVPGAKLYSYAAGTLTPLATYTTAAGTSANANPVVCDTAGQADVWLAAASYRMRLFDALGVLLWDEDNIAGSEARTLDSALRTDFASRTDAAKGAGLAGFGPGASYALGTVGRKLLETVSVVDYMTAAELTDWLTGAPALDHTAACNRATLSTLAFSGNNDAPKRRVLLPAGNWNIAGPVYVRKGQEFTGAGAGATRILQDPSRTTAIFVLGRGLIGGVETADPGGLAPVLSNLHVHSSSATAAAIDTGAAAGFLLSNLFLTNTGIGISARGADGVIDQCIFDQGLVALAMGEIQNLIVSNCLFYLYNYGIRIGSNTCDVQFDNCHFEYQKYASILFDDAATNIRNVSGSHRQFVLNEQFATFQGFIHIRTGDAEGAFNNFRFRNMKGYAVTHGSGIGGDFTFTNCEFNGAKTVPAYTQSTSSAGVQTSNETMRLIGCRWRNLAFAGVDFGGTFAGTVDIQGGSYSQIGGGPLVNISSTNGGSALSVQGVRGDGVAPLINAQSVVPVSLRGNLAWLGSRVTGSGRVGVAVPFQHANQWRVTVKANALPTGLNDYRKTASFLVQKENGNSSGARTSLSKTTLLQTPADAFVAALDIQIDLGAIGGGTTATGFTNAGSMIVSVPSSWASVDFDVEPLV